jgi:hypothetical protein
MKTYKYRYKKNKKTKKVEHFKTICNDSHYCLSLDIEQENIDKFFNYYIDFKYATSPIYTINEGNNGFIKKIIYNRNNYKSFAILKFQLKKKNDSLFYEYLVGTFLNNYTNKIPSFINTLGLYTYSSNSFDELKKNDLTVKQIKEILTHQTINIYNPDIKLGCKYNISILLEDVKPYYILDHMIKYINHYTKFIEIELINCLYQLYFTLYYMNNYYTHYDLHLGNVLFYKPVSDGYIKFIYTHNNGEKTIFNSQYIVKIIDYARSYFNNQHNYNSKIIQQQVCSTPECLPDCGDNYGYYWLNNNPSSKNSFISSKERNMSHDLRYLFELKKVFNKYNLNIDNYNSNLKDILSHVLYGVNIQKEKEKRYGTLEINETNYKQYEKLYPNTIKNVIDAKKYIQKKITFNDDYFKQFRKIGELHIYEDGRNMKYIMINDS